MYLNDESHERHDHFHEHDDDHDHYDHGHGAKTLFQQVVHTKCHRCDGTGKYVRKNTNAPCVVVKELSWRAKRSP